MQRRSLVDWVPVRTGGPSLSGAVVRTPVEAVGFWASVVLPVVYLPLFVAGSVDAARVAGFLLAHLLAVVAGHSYGR